MISWVSTVLKQRKNFLHLIWSDFSQNYLSSYIGFFWALINPLVMIAVLTLVFHVGFRVQPAHGDAPFVLWLVCGIIPWLYFADSLSSGAHAVKSYAFLVRKATFRISYLPVIRLAANSIIHAALLLFVLAVLLYFNFTPSVYWLQFFFYFFCMYLFLLGIAWFSSAVALFVPDVSNVLSVCTTIGFWLTPIFWSKSLLPEEWNWIFIINPAYYITQGYRDTFIEQRWFWERPLVENATFFLWLIVALALGSLVFKRLRPHFGDVL